MPDSVFSSEFATTLTPKLLECFGVHPQFDQELFLSETNGAGDPLFWIKKRTVKGYAEVLEFLISTYNIPHIQIEHFSCQSNAVLSYFEILSGLRTDDAPVALDLSTYDGPLPIMMIGHLIVLAHYHPFHLTKDGGNDFPRHLHAPVFVSVEDYLKLREDFIDRARDVLPGSQRRDLPEVEPADPSSMRSILKWISKQPTLGSRELATIDCLLALQDSDLDIFRVSSELACAIKYTQGQLQGGQQMIIPAGIIHVDRELLRNLGTRCADLDFVPFLQTSKQIFVAASRPEMSVVRDEISRAFTGQTPVMILAPSDDVKLLLADNSSVGRSVNTVSSAEAQEDITGIKLRLDQTHWYGKDPRKLALNKFPDVVYFFLAEATASRASDIHIDIFTNQTRVRYVIDNDAITVHSLPRDYAEKIAFHLTQNYCGQGGKDSNMPGVPRQGEITFTYNGKPIMSRIQVAFCFADPKTPRMVLRILDKSSGLKDMSNLGLSADEMNMFRDSIREPNGLILVSGATGSGKTTTLSACILDVNDPSRIIYTMEDPIEYKIQGVSQLFVASQNADATPVRLMTNDTLRILLRMDPEIIVVGELRDEKTATIAVEAANTGHLIFATTHANSILETFKRLTDLGVSHTDIAGNVRLMVGQRLVKRLCRCYRRVPLTPELIAIAEQEGVKHHGHMGEPVGCPQCRGSGYYTRIAVLEMLKMGDAFHDLIAEEAPLSKLREQLKVSASKSEFISLRKGAIRRIVTEQTSYAEIKRMRLL